MKNVFKKSTMFAIVFATLLSNATEISTISNNVALNETDLKLENVRSGNLLSIKDYNGIVLYKELIKSSGTYKKTFDLTALPDGNYFFEVDKDLEISIIPFVVASNQVVFNKAAETHIFKPYVRQKEDLVLISKLSTNLEPLNIEVYVEDNGLFELAHYETIKETKIIERVYKLKKGSYKIILSTDDRVFTKFINN